MIKYKVVSRIVADKDCFERRRDGDFDEKQSYLQGLIDKYGFICYKIIAGMYIFYITPDIYLQGVKANLIEEISGKIKDYSIETMFLTRGQVVNHRMWYALNHSTIDYLKDELERVNKEQGILTINVYAAHWYDFEKEEYRKEPLLELVRRVKVDLGNMTLIENEKITNSGDIIAVTRFHSVKTFEDVLDTLVDYQDREFMNSRHIIDKFKDSDFYDVDNWLQRLNKFEFIFEDEK